MNFETIFAACIYLDDIVSILTWNTLIFFLVK